MVRKNALQLMKHLVESFFKAYKPNTRSRNLLKIIRGADGSSFPPCSKILHQHILRTNYISYMWKDSTIPKLEKVNMKSPTNSGWKEEGGSYNIRWFEGEQYPESIDILRVDENEIENEDDPNNDLVLPDGDSDIEDDDSNDLLFL